MIVAVYHDYSKTLKSLDENVTPIQVGAAISSVDLNILRDDIGKNISHKNRSYNELTAVYWMWKNVNKSNLYGLMHYRRFFALDHVVETRWQLSHIKYLLKKLVRREGIYFDMKSVSTLKSADLATDFSYLEENDCLVPMPAKFSGSLTIESQFVSAHGRPAWTIFREVLLDLHPEYASSFESFANADKFYPFNMFVMRRRMFNVYCDWLFSILNILEKRLEGVENIHPRTIGFLGERLFTFYLHYNASSYGNIRIVQSKVVFINEA